MLTCFFKGPNYARGVYALSVNGRIPGYIVQDVQADTDKRYIPRDMSS